MALAIDALYFVDIDGPNCLSQAAQRVGLGAPEVLGDDGQGMGVWTELGQCADDGSSIDRRMHDALRFSPN